jgi:hypothetical protein
VTPLARDPYEIFGVTRRAGLDEIKAAYRRACKQRHPDVGGSNEAMSELNTAYAFILSELKEGYERQQEQEQPWHDVGAGTGRSAKDETWWRDIYRDIDEELETLRRGADEYDERLRTMRRAAWEAGLRGTWAKLTWDDLLRFLHRTARSGVKGLALLFAALVGVGSILVEANVISGVILLDSGIGFAFSVALKSDKGGVLSAGLLLFGVMTLWLPPVQSALWHYPLATLSVLILLALIFKFAQAGGTVGLMTGGVLALYVIGVIVGDTSRQPGRVARPPHPQITPPFETFTPTPHRTEPLSTET